MPQDRRLAELFDRYSLKATFNLNCEALRKINSSKEELQEIFLSKGHKIAVHGAYHRATGSLRYSADGHMIYNPTLYTIWFDVDGNLHSIASGEAITLPK